MIKNTPLTLAKQPILFVINPNAGTDRRKEGFKDLIHKYLDTNSFDPHIVFTERAKHATELTKTYYQQGIREFVAIGGDGTINEIGKELVNTEANLSLISKGSGNGLARHLNLYENEIEGIKKIPARKPHKIDVGLLNKTIFLCTAGVGFDALCAHRFSEIPGGRGLKAYVRTAFGSYRSFKSIKLLNGQEVFSLTFGNAAQFGNNAFVTPLAEIDDGLLDCSLVKPHPWYAVAKLGQQLFTKKIDQSVYVEYQRAKSFEFDFEEPQLIHIDGEALQQKEKHIEVNIIEKALSIRI
ncbi:diacylglycerol/lipid kinase family protein [Jiulongibacter sediminis]|uniref:diacylglycerol/lipid kinase family protein n=1 Tax=Jiulongibacter sediminis TaxID=1605367 RepID=UPI0012FD9770|nr:diacylglycerol kinase family protein [Jiulongibacter sediminis]